MKVRETAVNSPKPKTDRSWWTGVSSGSQSYGGEPRFFPPQSRSCVGWQAANDSCGGEIFFCFLPLGSFSRLFLTTHKDMLILLWRSCCIPWFTLDWWINIPGVKCNRNIVQFFFKYGQFVCFQWIQEARQCQRDHIISGDGTTKSLQERHFCGINLLIFSPCSTLHYTHCWTEWWTN